MDFTNYSNFVMPPNWFEQLKAAMGDSLEPALKFLGTMMKKGCQFPYFHIRPPRRVEAGVLAWMLLREMTMEKLYEDPRLFSELMVTLTVHTLGEYKNEPRITTPLADLARVAEGIIQGVIAKQRPWKTVEPTLSELIQAAPAPAPADNYTLPWWYPLPGRETYKEAQAA